MLRQVLSTASLAVLLLTLAAPGRRGFEVSRQTSQEDTDRVRALPRPELRSGVSLEQALARRRSVREFSPRALTDAQIAQLLWAAQGVTDARGFRTAPSAGGTFPLEVYVVLAEGCYRYDPQQHVLVSQVQRRDLRPALARAAIDQEWVRQAPAVFVFAAVYGRTGRRYGAARAPRYVHMEAGHAAQNILLQAAALGLGSVPVGAFEDARVKRLLELSPEEEPLYLVPVGHPR